MCGIVGAFPLNKPNMEMKEQIRRRVLLYLHNEILFETVARGKDATGIAIGFGAGPDDKAPYWTVLKQPVPTSDFFENDGSNTTRYKGQDEQANIERFMHVATLLNRPFKQVLGHTRAKTKGTEFNPLNNHPIMVGNVIGIHNGKVSNDYVIYKNHSNMTPQGDVDSEAIIQLLAENAPERPLGAEDIKFVTERIEGARAVIAYNRLFPEQVIYFHDKERPLELVYVEELGSAFICSEKRFFNTALERYERARLTVRRDLPGLSYEWRNVPDSYGGVINVDAEIDDTMKVEDMFPLVQSAKLLDEYSTTKKTTTAKPTTATTSSGKNSSGSFSSFNNRGKTPTTKSSGDTKLLPGPSERDAETEPVIQELSDFGPEIPTEASPGRTQQVSATAVMDDNEDDEETNVLEVYDDEELRRKGIEYALSGDAREDENLFINKHEGNFKGLLSQKKVTEKMAGEIIGQVYPEAFGDGYCQGFKDGVEEQQVATSEQDEQISEAYTSLETKNASLTKEVENLEAMLADTKKKASNAASYIANMKSFLMAAMITNSIAFLNEKGDLKVDKSLINFINSTSGFKKLKMDKIINLFTENDIKIIENSLREYLEVKEYEENDSYKTKQILS